MIYLSPDEIHLWFAFPDKIIDPVLLNQYQTLLTQDELTRWQQFHFAKHQHQYLITRALVRTTLSRYAHTAPQHWQFSSNQYGKPAISPPQNLFFNLSNTETLIVCAVSRQAQIGIDVESLQHKSNPLEIAQRFFSPQEVHELLALPPSQQRQHFFQYWTLKEAYIKACGLGLSQPLEQFSFSIHQQLTLNFHSPLKGNAAHWQCQLMQVKPHHYAGLCVYNPQFIRYQLQVKSVIPLQKEHDFNITLLAKT